MSATEKKACIIGWPVAHSRSPLIHGYWLKKYEIAGSYMKRRRATRRGGRLPARHAAGGLRRLQRHHPPQGGGVRRRSRKNSRPRKRSGPPIRCGSKANGCSRTTPTVRLHAPFARLGSKLRRGGHAVAVLGAGGAARCVIHAMLEAGSPEVRVFNRTRDRADVVARHFGPRVKPYDWRDRADWARDVGLLINATSLGMHGADALDMPLAQLPDACIVADLVYVPLLTPLLASARARGLVTVDGLGMLLHQATPGFQKWFGVAPEVTPELRERLVADIEGK